jgi:hypothetical protein
MLSDGLGATTTSATVKATAKPKSRELRRQA